jgi:putative OPT family oligopeptide transporter
VVVSTIVIGLTIQFLDHAYATPTQAHGIGTDKFPAPQATLMATIIKGVMSQNLDWGMLLIGAGLAITVFLCGVSPLAWAVGVYLPISTTFPIFLGGLLRWLADKMRGESGESEISPGMLFATGLVAGGTLTGVFSAILKAVPAGESDVLTKLQAVGEGLQHSLSSVVSLDLFALLFYVAMGFVLVKVAIKKTDATVKG